MRSSAFLAGYLNFYMQLLFKNLTLVQSSVSGSISEQLVQIGPGDVLLGISFPRYSKTAVNAVQDVYKRQGSFSSCQPSIYAFIRPSTFGVQTAATSIVSA